MVFFPLINKPTRISKHSATIIDNIFYNNIEKNTTFNGILITDLSDHFPIFHIDNINNNSQRDNFFFSRSFNDDNMKMFTQLNINTDWNDVLVCDEPQKAYTKLIIDNYNQAFTLKRHKSGYKNKLPWLTSSLRTSIKNKNRLFRNFRKHPSQENESLYKLYRNKLLSLLRKTERNYLNRLINDNKTNLKKKWSILKEIINKKCSSAYPTHFNII